MQLESEFETGSLFTDLKSETGSGIMHMITSQTLTRRGEDIVGGIG